MKTIPTPIKLERGELDALRKANDETEALQRFVQHVVQQGQLKTQSVQSKVREVYRGIRDRTGLDLENVVWVPDFDLGVLVPTQVKLVSPPEGAE